MTLSQKQAEKRGWRITHEEEGGWIDPDQQKVGRQSPTGAQKAFTDTVAVKREGLFTARREIDDTNSIVEQSGHSLDELLERIEAWESTRVDRPSYEPVE